jgi:hypothetical protein
MRTFNTRLWCASLCTIASTFFLDGALGCASCGSGGDDPLILYPNQEWRFYLGASRAFGFKTIRKDGSLGDENAPQFKDAITLAIGKAISPHAFVTFTLPYLQNWKNGTYKRAVGDPILAARWTLVPQDISLPLLPQVQFLASYRFTQARPQQEAESPYRLDVFGQGVPETKMGVDVFQGMYNFKFGAAQSFLFPGERNLGGQSTYPGFGSQTVLSFGYGVSKVGQVLTGFTRETRSNKKSNGVEIEGSSVTDNGFFVNCDAEVTTMQVARLTWSQKTPFWDSKNGSRKDSVSFAWLWSVAPQ